MATQPSYIYGDTANAVLNTARSRVNDLIQTPVGAPTGSDPGQQLTQVGGAALLTELNDDGSLCLRTQIIFNSAYRKFQKQLANLGWRGMIKNVDIDSMPANSAADSSEQSWISWNGCFDGTSFFSTPALPSTLWLPLRVWERRHNSSPAAQLTPVQSQLNGLRTGAARFPLNYKYEWRDNALYFPGASAITDLQIRAQTYFPDLVATGSPATPWYYQTMPIPGCLSPLAWYIVLEVCFPRGDEPGASGALAAALDETDQLYNDQARADQRPPLVNQGMARTGASGAPGTAGA